MGGTGITGRKEAGGGVPRLAWRAQLPQDYGVEWKRLVYFKRKEGRLWPLRGSRKGSGPTSHAWFPGTEKPKLAGSQRDRCLSLQSYGWVWPQKRPGKSGMCGIIVL